MVQQYAIANYNTAEARRLYAQPDHLNHLRMQGIPNPQVSSINTFLAATQRLIDHHGKFRVPEHAQARGRPHI